MAYYEIKKMYKLRILNSREKSSVLKLLEDQFGIIEKLQGIFLMSDRDKLYYMSEEGGEVLRLEEDKALRIAKAGLFIGVFSKDYVRLSVEGAQLFGPLVKKNILSINDYHLEPWLKGEDFILDEDEKQQLEDEGFCILKHDEDFIGCGVVKNGVVKNHLTKSRRVKNVNN